MFCQILNDYFPQILQNIARSCIFQHMTAERSSRQGDQDGTFVPRQPKDAYDAQGGFEATLGVLSLNRNIDTERKQHRIIGALVEKKKLEAINAYNLDVDLEEEGTTDYVIPPVDIDISSQEADIIAEKCGASVLSNFQSMNDQVVRGVYRALGASYPDDTVGDVPGEEEKMKKLPDDLRLALSKKRVTYTPSYLSPFIFQRVGIIGSDNQFGPGAVMHRFIKSNVHSLQAAVPQPRTTT